MKGAPQGAPFSSAGLFTKKRTHVAAKKKKDKSNSAEKPKNVVAAARKGGGKVDAKKFWEQTKCDSLAVAIGTSHGAFKFKHEAKLAFDRIEQIMKTCPGLPPVTEPKLTRVMTTSAAPATNSQISGASSSTRIAPGFSSRVM